MNRNVVQLGQQLLGIWKQLGLNQRISVVLAAGVVLVGLAAIIFWSSRVDYGLVYGRLDDAEAAKVVAYLEETKIPHKLGQGGKAIYVPNDKVHQVRMQLALRGIPRGDGVGFEIFDKPNFGISDFVQRANYLRAIQGELARTIAQLDGVESARVSVTMPENRLLVGAADKAKAAVIVMTRGNGLTPAAAAAIRLLVANSVERLQPSQVFVTDQHGTHEAEIGDPDSPLGLSQGQLKARRDLEQYFAKKVESMLEVVLGPGQAVVRVSAEINTDTKTVTEKKIDPETSVVRSNTTTDETTDTSSATGGGTPGITANMGSDTNAPGGSPLNKSLTKKKNTTQLTDFSETTSSLTQVAGGVKRLSAAVLVAARFTGAGAERKTTPRTPEELQRLRRVVQDALGIQSGADGSSKDAVTLEEVAFNDQFAEVGKVMGQQEKKLMWWSQLQNFLYPALALGVLVIFWRLLKRTPTENIPVGAVLDQSTGEGGVNATVSGNSRGGGNRGSEWSRPSSPTAISPEVFNRLVQENPENFTQAIQTWLGRDARPEP